MQLKPEQLIPSLEKKPLPIVWISGDETLLVQEACDEVRRFARERQFGEREVLDAGPGFDWNSLLQSASSLSLFAEKKLIDLRLNAKLDQAGREALQAYAADPGEDNLLLVAGPKMDKAATAAKWFRQVTARTYFVQIWPIAARQLPQWIGQRLRRAGLRADGEALQLLAERVEGNLLAAAQEVEKLALLAAGPDIDAATVTRTVADNARFDRYALRDAALAGEAARCLRILAFLRAEGGEPLQILGMLCHELRTLLRMRRRVEGGENPNGVMQAERVWSSRTAVVGSALGRHPAQALEAMLGDALAVDRSVKGRHPGDPWDLLQGLLLRLAGLPTVPAG